MRHIFTCNEISNYEELLNNKSNVTIRNEFVMGFNDFGDDELLSESLTLILTDTGFLEYVRKGTIAFVDKKLDDTDESQGTLIAPLKQQKSTNTYKNLHMR